MERSMTIATAIVTSASVLVLYGAAVAQTGTAKSATQADFDVCNREAQMSGGSAAPGARGGVGATAGATGGTGSLSGGSTLSSPAPSASGGTQISGMATAGQSDPAYQQTYRECMRRRGF